MTRRSQAEEEEEEEGGEGERGKGSSHEGPKRIPAYIKE